MACLSMCALKMILMLVEYSLSVKGMPVPVCTQNNTHIGGI